MTETVLDQLLFVASKGFRLIPLHKNSKKPIPLDWVIQGSSDQTKIRTWYSIHAGANWGLVTGEESGVFVVDIDTKSGGDKTWAKLLIEHKIPKTIQVNTGSGGLHIYFKYPAKLIIRNSTSIVKGIDVRGKGGQVVIPPSVHPDTKVEYSWVPGLSPKNVAPAKAPKWLLELIINKQNNRVPVVIGGPMEPANRNQDIYSQSLALARQGADQDFVVHTMMGWRLGQKQLDISDEEIIATVKSAFKHVGDITQNDFDLNDVGNAQRMLKFRGPIMKYVVLIGWHIWDGKCWAPDPENQKIKDLAIQSAKKYEEDLKQEVAALTDRSKLDWLLKRLHFAISSQNTNGVQGTVDTLSTFQEVCTYPDALDDERSTYLLNCLNGTLDLRTLELKKHDPDLLITKLAPVNYNPKAKCPTFLQTLNYAFKKDKEMIAFMKRILGYSISGSIDEQCFFICYGPNGSNGKSTILEAIHDILGEGVYAKTSSAEAIASSGKSGQSGTSQSSLAALRKIRFASVNEFAAAASLDEELLKRLTGGDSVEARYLYKEVFVYRPCFKIWIRANNEPNIRDVGEAFWRRLIKIPFDGQIPLEKRIGPTEIREMMKSEAEGILAWLVQGFQEWYKNGIQTPAKVQTAIAQYRKDADVFEQFMAEDVIKDGSTYISRKVLYMIFRQWCEEQGIRYVMTNEKFSRGIADKLDQHRVFRQGSVPIWRGIKLTDEAKMNGMAQ